MFILSKTNFQDFENNLESFNTLKDAQNAMQAYYEEDKMTVDVIVGDADDADDDVTLFINEYSATAQCEEFWMEYQIYEF